jgi:hypothetical protein
LLKCKSFAGENYRRFLKASTPKTFTPSFILKIEITDVYLGTKYDDICISELFFNDRFITPYPTRYNEIKNVYIANDEVGKGTGISPMFQTIEKKDNTIYYKNNTDIEFISLLYPNYKYIKEENMDNWYIYSKSKANFNYFDIEYQIITWNEINHPNVETQMEHYNYSGIIILNNNTIIYSNYTTVQTIEKIIKSENAIFVIFLEVNANRGSEENNLNIYKFDNNSLNFLESVQILDSDLAGSMTYHKEADIVYTDLNNDNIIDIKIDIYDYKIVDFEKSKERKLVETKKIILK